MNELDRASPFSWRESEDDKTESSGFDMSLKFYYYYWIAYLIESGHVQVIDKHWDVRNKYIWLSNALDETHTIYCVSFMEILNLSLVGRWVKENYEDRNRKMYVIENSILCNYFSVFCVRFGRLSSSMSIANIGELRIFSKLFTRKQIPTDVEQKTAEI